MNAALLGVLGIIAGAILTTSATYASSLILMHATIPPPGGTRPHSILVVEDNASDVFLLERALEQQHIDFQLTHLRDGAQALAFIRGEEPYASAPRPDLILVNMNLPKVDGEEVIRQIRGARRLDGIPVCIWSSSEFLHGGESVSRVGADEFILKPSGLEEFMQIGKTVKDLLSFPKSGK